MPSAALAALLCAPLALAGLVDTCSDITDADKCVAHKNHVSVHTCAWCATCLLYTSPSPRD